MKINKIKNISDFITKFVIGSVIVAIIIVVLEYYNINSKYGGDIKKWSHKVQMLNQKTYISQYIINDIDGNGLNYSKFEGNVSVLVVWATWCGVCAGHFPYIARFNQMLKERNSGINIIPVAEHGDTSDKIKNFYAKIGVNINDLPPYRNMERDLFKSLGITGVPSYFILDEHARVIARFRPNWHKDEELFEMLTSGVGG